MYQREITEKEAGQRFDRYLGKLLPAAGSGFLHKMLRKKNITLNGLKATGGERVAAGDSVTVYFSEETLRKFMAGGAEKRGSKEAAGSYLEAFQALLDVSILYENEHLLLADKPAGMLSQKANAEDLSLNEWLIGYLLQSGQMKAEELSSYRPSVCNRLDRNTGGIVLCAKTLKGAQLFGRILKDKSLHKYYQAYVKGAFLEERRMEGYLRKDEVQNKVYITQKEEPRRPHSPGALGIIPAAPDNAPAARQGEAMPIQMVCKPLRVEGDKTLLEVELITGKSHQIRAHLASVGHPVLGDYKYGDRALNDAYKRKAQVTSQLLYAYKVAFPPLEAPFLDVSERAFFAKLPAAFARVGQSNHQDDTSIF